MEMAIFFNKKLGETPLGCLDRFRLEHPEYADLPGTYAGRLDPAAEGEMLFLFGDLVHIKDEYLKHDKIYSAAFAFGIATDTGDLLGVPIEYPRIPGNENVGTEAVDRDPDQKDSIQNIDEEKRNQIREKIISLKQQMYPAYSSKPVGGKPLFMHTREGNNVVRPTRTMKVNSCDEGVISQVAQQVLLERVEKICDLVQGDFRQKEIVEAWRKAIRSGDIPTAIPILTFVLDVSSGTYIRALTETISEVVGVPVVLFSLHRLKIKNN